MTTVSSKHVPRPHGDPPMTTHQGATLVDDMEIIRKLCLPGRPSKQAGQISSLTFGKPDLTPLRSTHQCDFVNPGPNTDSQAERDRRARDMRSKHFDFGFGACPPARTEAQASFQPQGHPRNKSLHLIGGPSRKNASSIFLSEPDQSRWAADLESTSRADYIRPDCPSDPFSKDIAQDHRASHFDFGADPWDMDTTANKSYKEPPPGFKRPDPARGLAPGVNLGSEDYPWGKDINSTNRSDFGNPVREEDSLTSFVQRTPIIFGDDQREMLTEQRGAYKKNEYVECKDLTGAQLTMLGVTREQILPQKIPLSLLSSTFHNSLGQSLSAH